LDWNLLSEEDCAVSIKVTTRQVGDVSVVDVVGRITLGEGASALRETIRGLVAKDQKKVILNLGEVSYIDSSGIGELVSGFTTVTNHGGVLKLLGLTKRVQDLLQITKLYTVFDVYDTETSAVRSFS
jgi:anti-sigma B factor antagonist